MQRRLIKLDTAGAECKSDHDYGHHIEWRAHIRDRSNPLDWANQRERPRVITSERTDGGGQVIFRSLPSSGQLCVSTANAVGVQVYRANHCADPFPATYTLKFGSKMPGN